MPTSNLPSAPAFSLLERQELASIDLEILGERIRRARIEKRLSQRALATGLFTSAYLSIVELGRTRPTLATLARLAERLDKTVAYFISPIGEGVISEFLPEQGQLLQTQFTLLQAEHALASGETSRASTELAEVKLHLARLSSTERAHYFYLSGLTYYKLNDYKLALTELSEVAEILPTPDAPDAELSLVELDLASRTLRAQGNIEFSQKRLIAALAYYRQALELVPSGFKLETGEETTLAAEYKTQLQLATNQVYWQLHLDIASSYLGLGEFAQAQTHFEKGLIALYGQPFTGGEEVDTDVNTGCLALQAEGLLSLAQLYGEQGDYTKASFYLGRSSYLYQYITDQKSFIELYTSLARLQLRLGNYQKAATTSVTALKLIEATELSGKASTSPTRARIILARSYLQGGLLDKADELVCELLHFEHDSASFSEEQLELYRLAAELATARGKQEEAERYYTLILTALETPEQKEISSVNLADFYYGYGQELRRWGETDKAFLYLDKALELRQVRR